MLNFDSRALQASLADAVRKLSDAAGESALRAAGSSGAELFRDEAKRNAQAHVKTGTLRDNIIVVRLEEESDGARRQVYKVTVRSNPAFYWRFVEFGHKFVPRNSRVSKRTGKKVGWKAHRKAAELEYGTASAPAYPFMRPAFESMKGEAVDMMSKTLQEQIKRNL